MKITVFGASGRTGQELLLQVLARGHDVTAVVRAPSRFNIKHNRLKVVMGDALQLNSFDDALAEQDAVLSTLGIAGFFNWQRRPKSATCWAVPSPFLTIRIIQTNPAPER